MSSPFLSSLSFSSLCLCFSSPPSHSIGRGEWERWARAPPPSFAFFLFPLRAYLYFCKFCSRVYFFLLFRLSFNSFVFSSERGRERTPPSFFAVLFFSLFAVSLSVLLLSELLSLCPCCLAPVLFTRRKECSWRLSNWRHACGFEVA